VFDTTDGTLELRHITVEVHAQDGSPYGVSKKGQLAEAPANSPFLESRSHRVVPTSMSLPGASGAGRLSMSPSRSGMGSHAKVGSGVGEAYPQPHSPGTNRKPKHLSHSALALILERGRPMTRRVPMDTAKQLRHKVCVYARVRKIDASSTATTVICCHYSPPIPTSTNVKLQQRQQQMLQFCPGIIPRLVRKLHEPSVPCCHGCRSTHTTSRLTHSTTAPHLCPATPGSKTRSMWT
jgi:hypothetical protein